MNEWRGGLWGRQHDSWVNAIQSLELVPESWGAARWGPLKIDLRTSPLASPLPPYKLNRSHFGVRTLPSPSQNTLRTRWLVKPTKNPQNNKKNPQETLMTTSLHPPQHRLFTPLLSGWRHRRVKCTPYRPRSSSQQWLDGSIVQPPWSLLLPAIITIINFWRKICVELESRRYSSI